MKLNLKSAIHWFYADFKAADNDTSDDRIDYARCFSLIFIHLGCLGIFWVGWSWTAVSMALFLYFTRMFAITAFLHRYFSHRTFKTNRFFQFIFAVIASSAMQRGALWWAAHHRKHHKESDTEKDVHSPHTKSFLWSHIGWITSRKNFLTDYKVIKDFSEANRNDINLFFKHHPRDRGYINYQGGAFRFVATDGDPLRFGHVSNTDRVTIDTSGDLIVGGTSSGANDAVSISNTGYIQAIINGDTAAMAIAKSLKSRRLLLMTNVDGVLDKNKKLIEEISSSEIMEMIKDETITEGMIPKINTCLDAVDNGVTAVGIIAVSYTHLRAHETPEHSVWPVRG